MTLQTAPLIIKSRYYHIYHIFWTIRVCAHGRASDLKISVQIARGNCIIQCGCPCGGATNSTIFSHGFQLGLARFLGLIRAVAVMSIFFTKKPRQELT